MKAADPDALVLGEEWGDASAWLLGTEADSVDELPVPARRHRPRQRRDRRPRRGDRRAHAERLRRDAWRASARTTRRRPGTSSTTSSTATTRPASCGRSRPATTTGGRRSRPRPSPSARRSSGWSRRSSSPGRAWPASTTAPRSGSPATTTRTTVGRIRGTTSDDRRSATGTRTLATLRADHEALRSGDLSSSTPMTPTGTLAFGRRTDAEAAITVLNLSRRAAHRWRSTSRAGCRRARP